MWVEVYCDFMDGWCYDTFGTLYNSLDLCLLFEARSDQCCLCCCVCVSVSSSNPSFILALACRLWLVGVAQASKSAQ